MLSPLLAMARDIAAAVSGGIGAGRRRRRPPPPRAVEAGGGGVRRIGLEPRMVCHRPAVVGEQASECCPVRAQGSLGEDIGHVAAGDDIGFR